MNDNIKNLKKENNKLRNEVWDLEMKLVDWHTAFFVALFLVSALFIMVIFSSDNIDEEVIGNFMCERNNATFVSIETDEMNLWRNYIGEEYRDAMKMKIVCTRDLSKPIEDGYLFIQ